MSQRLRTAIAVVTGAAGGIGKAICTKFASEGASLVLVDLNKERLSEVFESLTKEYGDKHFQASGDVADSSFAKQLFENVTKKYGNGGNVIVNCAGIGMHGMFLKSTEEDFDKVIRINLKSVYVMTKAFADALKTDSGMRSASIINISSVLGKTGAVSVSQYAASKAGIIGFTKSVGIELGSFGIRSNAVLPGLIETEMTQHILSDQKKAQLVAMTPLKKLAKPEDVANACLFLASDESSMITCSSLEVAGGYMA